MKITSIAIVFVASIAPANAGFSAWTSMPGGPAPMKPSSYAPGAGGKPYAPTSGSGMGNYVPGSSFTPPLPDMPDVTVRGSGAPPTTSGGSYLEQMGGGAVAAPVKKASFAPGGGKPYSPTSGSGMGSFLENFAPSAGATALPPPPPPPAAASSSASTHAADAAKKIFGSYLDQVAGAGSAPVKKASYAPGGGKPYAPTGGSGMGSYLENVAPAAEEAPAVAAVAQSPAAYVAPTSASYLEQMGGGSAPVKEASYAPGGKPYVFGGTGLSNYLENVATPAAFVSAPADPSSDNNAVLEAIFRMNNNMNTNQKQTIEVLKDISSGVRTLVSKASARGGATSGHWQ